MSLKIKIISTIFLVVFLSSMIFSASPPKPVLYFSFEKTFSPEIMNTHFFFDPNPKLLGDVRLVKKDGDYCLYFDGESFIKYKATNLLDYDNFSVSLWLLPIYISTINRNDWDNMTTLFSVRTNIPHDFPEWALVLYRSKGETKAFVFYVSKHQEMMGWNFDLPTTLTDNQWHNLILTKTPDTIKIYLDGELIGSAGLKVSERFVNLLRSDYLTLGGSRRIAMNSKFKGYMDDFAVWNVVLSDDQVKNIYKYGGIGKEEIQSEEFDIEKAKVKLREAYNEGKISYEQLKKALNEIISGNPSKLLIDFVNGVISVDDFAILY